MTLAELGMLLRGERVRCGYSVDEVASRLKITSRVVRSIEEGDLDGLPHAVYASGFIRAYATLVGVGEEEIRSALHELVPPEETNSCQAPSVPSPSVSSKVRWLAPVLVVLVIAGGVYGLYAGGAFEALAELSGFWNKASMQATPAASRAESEKALAAPVVATGKTQPVTSGNKSSEKNVSATSQTPQGSVTATPTAEASARQAGTSATPSQEPATSGATSAPAVSGQPAPASATSSSTLGAPGASGTTRPGASSEAEPVRTTGFAQISVSPLKPATPETIVLQGGTPGQTERAGQGKNQIILTALEECWVHSSADGTDIRQFSINKGDVFALSFTNKLVLKLGNAGGVQIKYNGQQMPAPGTSGQVKTLTFPPTP